MITRERDLDREIAEMFDAVPPHLPALNREDFLTLKRRVPLTDRPKRAYKARENDDDVGEKHV